MKKGQHVPPDGVSTHYVGAELIASKYNITARYVLLMAAKGKIPCIRLGKKCVRFNETAVASVLEGGLQ